MSLLRVRTECSWLILVGGHGGIGLETVLQLAKWKTQIWALARKSSLERCEEAMAGVRKETGNPNVFCDVLDLSSLRSVSVC
jgi:NAD(P)-dependent dehydrogenase (short-subunit alcohol dehydrogenase family)